VRDVEVTSEFIALGQLLQLAGVVDTGGEAKNLIGTLTVAVNGEPEGRRGRKLIFAHHQSQTTGTKSSLALHFLR